MAGPGVERPDLSCYNNRDILPRVKGEYMSIFHACDIRGVAGQELTDTLVRQIARAVGVKLSGQRVVVGGDVRLSTPVYKKIFAETLAESGCQVTDIGIVATPVFYFALSSLGATGGVMVTASHNPAKYNGFKLVLGPQPVTEQDIQEIAALAGQNACVPGAGSISQVKFIDKYIKATAEKAQAGRLKIVLDAGNGATALTAPKLFRQLGYEVEELYCEPDGRFPHRAPNPALAENLVDLGRKVLETGAALGIAFDGDGDRVGFVDETGRPADNDDIIVLLARYYLEKEPGTIIYDAKCSMVVPEEVAKAGGRPVMARAGHTFSKAAFLQEKALFAGEISGHFFFRELGYDDGVFAALKICEFVADHGSLAALVDAIPNYYLTPDIRIPYTGSDKEAILAETARKLSGYKPNLIDGVRIEFADGWGMIRASVTEPLFTLRFEAKTIERQQEIAAILLAALPENLRLAIKERMP
jgi:phosphomannomutase/phosphoglucomutase